MLVSHDRYFLDVTVRKIVELWNKGLHFYTGGYTRYEEQKTERRAQLQAAYDNQQDRIRQLEAFINRFRYQATKAKQVQSRIKELERIERIEIPPEEKTIHFRFPQPKPSGRMVAEFKEVAKSYGDHLVFSRRGFHHRARRPRRAGGRERRRQIDADQDAGRRGAGDRGRVHAGPQRAARLLRAGPVQGARPRTRACSTTWRRVAPRATNTELRSLLGCFLFSEDDVFKTIGVLSGGERNRYALARMLMHALELPAAGRAHQPPGHARQGRAARRALEEFTGTVVFVSHDRYFIDKLATRVFEVEDGGVHVYPRQLRGLPVAQERRRGPTGGRAKPPAGRRAIAEPGGRAAAPDRLARAAGTARLNPIKLRQMKERRREIEDEVTRWKRRSPITKPRWAISSAWKRPAASSGLLDGSARRTWRRY